MIIPSDLADVAGIIKMASSVIRPQADAPSLSEARPKSNS